jgi:GntR family transcriptional regulator, transcriptional repressor for pyruvate dehydrogenase complex
MQKSKFEFEPIKKDPIVIELTRRLLDFIFSGSIQPGEKLPTERQLQEALNVGRSSIREAVKVLNVLGILEVKQGDGTYLTKADSGLLLETIEWGLLLGQKHTMDVIEARHDIEIAIVKYAAERGTEEELNELWSILEKLKVSTKSDFVELDIAFHVKLAEMAKNSALKSVLLSLQSLLRTWIKTVIDVAPNTTFSYEDHYDIYVALAAHDPEKAEIAMKKHMGDATRRLIEEINKEGMGK